MPGTMAIVEEIFRAFIWRHAIQQSKVVSLLVEQSSCDLVRASSKIVVFPFRLEEPNPVLTSSAANVVVLEDLTALQNVFIVGEHSDQVVLSHRGAHAPTALQLVPVNVQPKAQASKTTVLQL